MEEEGYGDHWETPWASVNEVTIIGHDNIFNKESNGKNWGKLGHQVIR